MDNLVFSETESVPIPFLILSSFGKQFVFGSIQCLWKTGETQKL